MDSNVVVVKKKNKVWKIITILLAVGAICVVAAKIYQKFFKNKKVEAIEADAEDETLEIEGCDEAAACEEEEAEALEVPAEAVIANVEDMEEPEND